MRKPVIKAVIRQVLAARQQEWKQRLDAGEREVVHEDLTIVLVDAIRKLLPRHPVPSLRLKVVQCMIVADAGRSIEVDAEKLASSLALDP